MLPIEEISRRIWEKRKALKLNQRELSKLSGVSQGLISKIECGGDIDPKYENVRKILLALEKVESKGGKEKKAKDIMERNVRGLQITDNAKKAADIMSRKKFSQLPVYKGKEMIGSISYPQLLGKLEQLSEMNIEEVMEEPFPTIDKETPLKIIGLLLKYRKAVIVKEKNKIVGIITEDDLLKILDRD